MGNRIIKKIGRLTHSKNSYGYNLELNVVRREGVAFYAIGNFPVDKNLNKSNALYLTEAQAKALSVLLDKELSPNYQKEQERMSDIFQDADLENEKYYKDYIQQSYSGTFEEHMRVLDGEEKERVR